MGLIDIMYLLIQCTEKDKTCYSCQISISLKKYLENPNWGLFHKITGQYSSKISVLKDKERIRNYSRLKGTKQTWQVNTMCDPELSPILKKNISTTRGEI